MVGIMISLPISGGHINPAVTIAFAAAKKLSWAKVPHYIIAQYLGSFMAQVLLFVMHFDALEKFDGGIRSAYGSVTSTGKIFATYPAPSVSLVSCIADQIIGTALLLIGVSAIIDNRGLKMPVHLQPFIISLWIAAMATALGFNSGAIMNPARDLAPRLFTALVGYGWKPFQPLNGHYWYSTGVIAPHIGALLGVFIYEFFIGSVLQAKQEKELEESDEDILVSNMMTPGESIERIHMNHFQIHVDPHRIHSQSLSSSISSDHQSLKKNNMGFANKTKILPIDNNNNNEYVTSNYSYDRQDVPQENPRSRSKSISYGASVNKDLSQ